MEFLAVQTQMVTDGGMFKMPSQENQHNGPMLMVMAMETMKAVLMLMNVQTLAEIQQLIA
jgi:hypothetical protein